MELAWIVGIVVAVVLAVALISSALVLLAVMSLPPPNPNNFLARYWRANSRSRQVFWDTLEGKDEPPP
jgi:hypothetical protein